MRGYPYNRLTEPAPQSGDRRCGYDVADGTGRIVALRRNKSEMRTILLPLSAVGETCQMESIAALLQRIEGVRSACLFFNRTALRIYYHPDQTNVNQIVEVLRVLKPNRRDYHNLEKDLPRTAISG